MTKYYFIIFILISIAILILAKLSLKDLYVLYKDRNAKAIRIVMNRIDENNSTKIRSFTYKTKKMLELTGAKVSLSEYIFLSIFISIIISFVGILLRNILLAFLLFIATNILIHQYLKHIYFKKSRKLQKELNLSLSLITNSYLENNNLVKAIKSNIYKLPENIKEVFGDFLVQVEMVDPDLRKGVLALKKRFDNIHLKRWCDLVIHCINDRDYIKVLPAVVNEIADERESQEKYDSMVNEVYKENLQLLFITALTPFILKVVFPEMLHYLTNTTLGKIIISVSYFLLAITSGVILTINRPISYNIKEKNE